MLALDDRKRSRSVSRRKPPSGSRSIKNILDPDGKRRRWRRRHETCACRRHIVSLTLGFLPPRVTDLADAGLHIFNHFFLESRSRLVPLSFTFSFVVFLLSGHAYRVFFYYLYLPFSLLPSFSELSGNVCAFHPEKWIFSFGKKERKKRVFVTRCMRVASGPRANEAVPSV